jgi:hypothetical protein
VVTARSIMSNIEALINVAELPESTRMEKTCFPHKALIWIALLPVLDYSIRAPLTPFISPGFYDWTDRGDAI